MHVALKTTSHIMKNVKTGTKNREKVKKITPISSFYIYIFLFFVYTSISTS